MTSDIQKELQDLLPTLSLSIKRVTIHVGTNDAARQQSELTKSDLNHLFDFLKNRGMSVFISGPIPTVGRCTTRFSRLLSLHTWLQSTCTAQNVGFIDNFNLFWNRRSLFNNDGVHPNRAGSQMLSANIQHTVLSYPRA